MSCSLEKRVNTLQEQRQNANANANASGCSFAICIPLKDFGRQNGNKSDLQALVVDTDDEHFPHFKKINK